MAQQPQLVLAVHTVEAATAKVGGVEGMNASVRPTDFLHVPFSMILLLDFAKRRATPAGCKCRMVVPSDGTSSVSLWDTLDPAALQEWLNENLGGDCTTQLHEVQEDFTFGISLELARMRAAEKVADGSKKTIGVLGERTGRAAETVAAVVHEAVGNTKHQLEEWDQRTGVITTAKETTAAIQQRVIGAMSKAAENQAVQSVVTNVSSGMSSGWARVSNWVGQRLTDLNVNDGAEEYGHAAEQYANQQHQQHQYEASLVDHGTPVTAGGGLHYSDSADRPLTFSNSMLNDPAGAAAAAGSPHKASS